MIFETTTGRVKINIKNTDKIDIDSTKTHEIDRFIFKPFDKLVTYGLSMFAKNIHINININEEEIL